MSRNYYALPLRDHALVGGLIEGTAKGFSIDAPAIREHLCATILFKGDPEPETHEGTLEKYRGNAYLYVDVMDDHVLITSGGDASLDGFVFDAIEVLQDAGLHVFDPQRGAFL